jgi:2-hydroxychromene-2-carboxylate isomerase
MRPVPTPTIDIVHYTDPACPWAYSAEPAFRALEWRYGDALRWRIVTIGLSEAADAARSTYTPARRVHGWSGFQRRFGMPFLLEPRSRVISSGRACRAVHAAARQGLAAELLRAVRLAWFTTTLLLDEDDALAEVAASVPGLDAAALVRDLDDPQVEAAYQADRRETRSAGELGPPAVAQRKSSTSSEGERFTAPSLVFHRNGEVGQTRKLVAGGWQPLLAYDLCVANLAPELPRRDVPGVAELLAASPQGLVTQEIARVCTEDNDDPDRAQIERELVDLCAQGAASRTQLGSDALWKPVATTG